LKKIIKLANCVIELTILKDGAVVLAEIKRGYVGKKELLPELKRNGYAYGIIEQNMAALESGQKGQVILATAIVQDIAAGIWSHSTENKNSGAILESLENENFNFNDITFNVKENERLLTITSTPKTVLRYPDGRKEQLKDLGMDGATKLCGKNTHLNTDSKSIRSDINGSMHSSIYGVISVYPVKEFKSIGRVHGKVVEDNAIAVERDILPDSFVKNKSNLIVDGFIRSSIINTEGNVLCRGIENPLNHDRCEIMAGQSIFTRFIKKYLVWSGESVFVDKIIEKSTIQCLGTIAASMISDSEIRVGGKLFTKNINGNSKIFLGNIFVENEELKKRKSFHLQHKKRLIDLEDAINLNQAEIESNRSKSIAQIKKLRKLPQSTFETDILLKRFFITLTDRITQLNKKIDEYETDLRQFEKERLELSFCDQQLKEDSQPEIIVTGKIEPGTVITAPNQELKVTHDLTNVSIKLDKIRGILNIQHFKHAKN